MGLFALVDIRPGEEILLDGALMLPVDEEADAVKRMNPARGPFFPGPVSVNIHLQRGHPAEALFPILVRRPGSAPPAR